MPRQNQAAAKGFLVKSGNEQELRETMKRLLDSTIGVRYLPIHFRHPADEGTHHI
jgi:hypothetical protein